jgi:hypothetical protein
MTIGFRDDRSFREPFGGARGVTVLTLVSRARARLLRNDLLAQGVNAFTAALSAFILLLLFGAEVLNWRWLVPIPLAAAAAGAYRALRRRPSPYRTAQLVDRRMGLSDALATAVFFNGGEPSGGSLEIRRCQLERAEVLSRTVDVRRAIPYSFPRAAYASGALFLVASSLFALRFGVTRRLDLKPPLAAILKLDLRLGQRVQEAKAVADPPPEPEPRPAENTPAADEDPTRRDQAGARRQAAPQSGENSKGGREGGGRESESSSRNREQRSEEQPEGAGDPQQQRQNQQAAESRQPGRNGTEKQDPGQNADAGQQNGGEGSSLMDKFRDAVQNLLSRMKPSQQQQGGRQQQSEPARGQNQGRQQQNGAGPQQARSGQQQTGEGQGNSEQGEADRTAREAAGAQRQAARGDSEPPAKQPGSGIGSDDGNKEIKQAAQLAAMGKISEILGKRAADLSGEATVEVQSSDQQLRTPYAEHAARHSATGAEIGRDEIPLALQSYIEHYFEQVRKQKK